MVMHFDFHADRFQRFAHGGTDVLKLVDRRHREVAALDRRTVAGVAVLVVLARVPGSILRVDVDVAAPRAGVRTDRVEDEEFVFRTEVRRVGDAGRLQVGHAALGDRARITLVTLHGCRLDHVAAQHQRGFLEERVDERGTRIRHQDHVRLVDALPAGDRRTVEHLAVDEQLLIDGVGRHADVLFLALGIAEPEVHILHGLLGDHLQYVFTRHGALLG